jgi:hypothetical protein
LAVAGTLAASSLYAPKADAAVTNIHAGIDIPGYSITNSTMSVTNGQVVTFGVRVASTNNIALDDFRPIVQIGSGTDYSATNFFTINSSSIMANSSKVVTNPISYFWNENTQTGLGLSTLSYATNTPNSTARLGADIGLSSPSQRLTNDGYVALWTGTINYTGQTNYFLNLGLPAMQAFSNGTSYTLLNGKIANDINPGFRFEMQAIPEPSTLSLVGLGLLGALALTNARRKR